MNTAGRHIIGEIIGTAILVFLGCGSVAYSNLVNPLSLILIASIWGIAVALAIYASRKWSYAHLNPAVSLGFFVGKEVDVKSLVAHLFGQVVGATLAAIILFFVFQSRLVSGSITEAMAFGEYYPNPGSGIKELSTLHAVLFEGMGTFILMMGILWIIRIKKKNIHPILIGFLLAVLIVIIAPYTQAGFNPARDALPRFVSYIGGYEMAYSHNGWGNVLVYVIAPIIGAMAAILLFKKIKRA